VTEAPRRTSIDELLELARARLERLSPAEVVAATAIGAVLIDIRSQDQRRAHGVVPGALYFPRNHLEWCVDPESEWADPAIGTHETQVVLMCHEGYATSLAAVTLQDLGFARATDMVGGFVGWRDAGLAVEPFDEERHGYDRD
jgi:rhodanese-related sulfurtransferase